MPRIFTLCCAPLFLVFTGCQVGNAGDDSDPENEIPEQGETQLKVACEAYLTVTGSLAPSGVTPGEEEGCIPDGTWSLQVTVEDVGDCTDIPINAEYVYVVSRDADDLAVMAYQGSDGNAEADRLIPGSAGGTCRANIEHYSADKLKVVYLQPHEDDLVISGSGTYELWEEVEVAPE